MEILTLNEVIASLPDFVFWKNRNSVYQGCNQNAARLLGLAKCQDIVGKTDYDLSWDKCYLDQFLNYDKKVFEKGEIISVGEVISCSNCNQLEVLTKRIPIRSDQGDIVGILVVSVERQHCNLSDQTFFSHILTNLPYYIFWKNRNSIYLGSNDNFAKLVGEDSSKDLVGKTDYELNWGKGEADFFREADAKVMEGQKQINTEEILSRPDGSQIVMLVSKTPVKNEENDTIGLLGISTDITELKQKERDLEIAKEKAEAANRLKSEFISNMEHDIRTPCSGIAQMVSILEEQEKNSKKRETLSCIARSSRQLLSLLNNIVEFEHIENGSIPILSKKFDFKKIVTDIIDLEMPSARSKKLELIVDFADSIPKILIGDDYRFERILVNLISNAVKFTEKGYIKVNAEVAGKSNEKTIILKIAVEDTGIGIPKDKQDIIYERFSRIIPANKGIYNGIGLGLKIVKQFVEEMEGEIEVESDVGKGSVFTVLLPFKIPLLSESFVESEKKSKKEKVIKKPKKLLKTLLVEDDELAQMVAKDMLESVFGSQVDVVYTGKEALKLAKNNVYDIIFMDIGLPDIDGNDVTKKIKEGRSYKSKNVPIIALTAHSTDYVRNNAEKSGMSDFILKPLNAEKIQKILNKWIYHEESDKVEGLEEADSNNVNKIEDKIIDMELTTKILNGNSQTAKEMIKTLVEMLPEYKYNLGKAFCMHDFDELLREAHKFYGATCYCGVPRLKSALKELEIIALKKNDERKIQEALNRTCTEIDSVMCVYEESEEFN